MSSSELSYTSLALLINDFSGSWNSFFYGGLTDVMDHRLQPVDHEQGVDDHISPVAVSEVVRHPQSVECQHRAVCHACEIVEFFHFFFSGRGYSER